MSEDLLAKNIEHAAALLREARYAVSLTGAGISTPSGIPDFRSPHSGLWEHYDPFVVASQIGFRRNPEKFFAWIRPLAHKLLEAAPNPAHYALAEMENAGIIKSVITQNIDMLHSKAGSKTIHELHGHLREATCVECFTVYPTSAYLDEFVSTGEIPRCPSCRGILKPNIILMGEQLPHQILQAAQQDARTCDVMLVAGSSLRVAPASVLPQIALAHGAQLIIINYEPTPIDGLASVAIHADVAEVLPGLASLLNSGGHLTG